MATSQIVFYDSPNAPRNSRVERGFSVSSHQSSSALASSGGSAATSRWCWKDKRSRRRNVSKSLATRAAARQLSYAGPTSITIPILVAVVPVPVASWLLNPFGSLRRSPYCSRLVAISTAGLVPRLSASLVPFSMAGLVPRLSADFMNCIDVHDWPYGRSCGRHSVDRCQVVMNFLKSMVMPSRSSVRKP